MNVSLPNEIVYMIIDYADVNLLLYWRLVDKKICDYIEDQAIKFFEQKMGKMSLPQSKMFYKYYAIQKDMGHATDEYICVPMGFPNYNGAIYGLQTSCDRLFSRNGSIYEKKHITTSKYRR